MCKSCPCCTEAKLAFAKEQMERFWVEVGPYQSTSSVRLFFELVISKLGHFLKEI